MLTIIRGKRKKKSLVEYDVLCGAYLGVQYSTTPHYAKVQWKQQEELTVAKFMVDH